jgi:hypothetical protein
MKKDHKQDRTGRAKTSEPALEKPAPLPMGHGGVYVPTEAHR